MNNHVVTMNNQNELSNLCPSQKILDWMCENSDEKICSAGKEMWNLSVKWKDAKFGVG